MIPPNTIYATVPVTVSPEAATSSSSSAAYTPPVPISTSTAAAYTPPAPVSTSTAAAYAPPAPTSTAVYYTPSVAEYYQASSSSAAAPPASSSASSSSSSASITSGSQWCMSYSPYLANGKCNLDSASIASDIASIAAKGFSCVRIYSTDCSGLQNVGAAAKVNGLKLVLGIYINDAGISVAAEQVGAITSWAAGDYSDVEMVVVGNEAIFSGFCSASDLANFIASTKSTLQKAGYSGPVTTTEPIDILQIKANAAALCDVVDVVAANIHPYFNPNTVAADAGTFVASTLEELATVCPGNKAVYNLETGWPNGGSPNGVAVPGTSEQEAAITSIQQKAGSKSVFFSFTDDLWKEPGPLGVEQNWGCSQIFGDS